MSQSRYSVLRAIQDPSFCGVTDLPQSIFPMSWKLAEGRSVADQYPPGVRITMSKHYPGIIAPDVIFNVALCTMVSRGVKEVLEQHSMARVEFLPFTLLNHKGRVASEDCFIVNVLDTVDCADSDRTVGTPSKMNPGTYSKITRLELDESRIPPEARLFRLKQLPSVMLVRNDLRAQLEAKGFSGLGFVEPGSACEIRS